MNEVVAECKETDKDKDKIDKTDKQKKPNKKKIAPDATRPNQRKTMEAALHIVFQHMCTHHPKTICEQFKTLLSHSLVKHAVADLRSLQHKRQTIISAIADLAVVIGREDDETKTYLAHLDHQINEHTRFLKAQILSIFRLHNLHATNATVVFESYNTLSNMQWTSAVILPSIKDITMYANKRDDDSWYNILEAAFVKAVVERPVAQYPVLILGYSVVGYHACLLVETGIVVEHNDPTFLEVIHSMVFKGVDKRWLKDLRECVTPNRFCHTFTRFDLPPVLTNVPNLPVRGALTVNEDLIRTVMRALVGKLHVIISGDVTIDAHNVYIQYPELFRLRDTAWSEHVIATTTNGCVCEDLASMIHYRAYTVVVGIENTPPLYVRYTARKMRYLDGIVALEQYIVDAVYRLIRASKGREPFSTHSFGGLACSHCTVAEGIFVDHAITPTYTSIEWISNPESAE